MKHNYQNIIDFGSMVFDDAVMRDRISKTAYDSLQETIATGKRLEPEVADIIANAMKDWAMEKGATHFCHWFMPMTGYTSEKHDAFLSIDKTGKAIFEFSGKNLIKGESDASSFPSGGLRATFEARGYTTWDCTSPAFVKERSLYIPTAFCSYNGEALDKKTPLLRSMELLNSAGLRLCKLLGIDNVSKVSASVGAEQEYFLIDREIALKRKDLLLTGRTLLGRLPSKGQEMEDHYFGNLKTRVANFMQDLDTELWRVGVAAKIKHNENAPAQHELAPIYSICNIAADHNYLTMEIMKKVAEKHNLVCLLHEKPFEGVNGSGKHNNWSLMTDSGFNFLKPGPDPKKNVAFLITLAAIISAVDDHSELLRLSISGAANDLRLGALEAPPAIVSVYLGDGITEMLHELITGNGSGKYKKQFKLNVKALPEFTIDNSDRNRTSPFAFTGNKFEFRMVGSSASICGPNTTINTIVADRLNKICDEAGRAAEKLPVEERHKLLTDCAKKLITDHIRIIYNGNNYSDDWISEAARRGLPNINNSVDAFKLYINSEKTEVLTRNSIYSPVELKSRYSIMMDNYIKTINIEALTLIEMLRLEVKQFALKYLRELTETLNSLSAISKSVPCLHKDIDVLAYRLNVLDNCIDDLQNKIQEFKRVEKETEIRAEYMRDIIIPACNAARAAGDSLEQIIPREYWTMPTYFDLFYKI